MGALLEALTSGPSPAWLDGLGYGQRVLLGGAPVPWLDTAAYGAFERDLHALVGSVAPTCPVGAVIGAWCAALPDAGVVLREKTSATYAARRILADDRLRSTARAIAGEMRVSHHGEVVAVSVPSPASLVRFAAWQAGHDLDAVDPEVADGIAMYLGDFLGIFSEAGIDAIVIEEGEPGSPGDSDDAYAPLLNSARHHRWDTVWRSLRGEGPVPEPDSFDVLIGSEAPASGSLRAVLLPEGYWHDGDPPPLDSGDFWFGVIPPDAQPETVLTQRGVLLRSAA